MFHWYSTISNSTPGESSKRGRASRGVQLGEKDMTEKRKRARSHQAVPVLGPFFRPLWAVTEVEHPSSCSKIAKGVTPGKETFEFHSQDPAKWEIFKVQIWSQSTLETSFSHFYSRIWSHLFLI